MDISTTSGNKAFPVLPKDKVVCKVVGVHTTDRPLSPWLRIAHRRRLRDSPGVVPLRRILDFEFLMVLEGSCWLWVEPAGGAISLQAGDAALIPPEIVHTWGGNIGSHLAVHFDLCAQPRLAAFDNLIVLSKLVSYQPAHIKPLVSWPGFGNRKTPIVQKLDDAEPWQTRMEKLISLSAGRTSADLSLGEQAEVQEYLLWILRSWMALATGPAMSDPEQRVRALLGQIDPATVDSIDQLAGRAHMSSTTFRMAFRRATGQPPHQWLESRRIDQASHRLLNTNLPVAVIAAEVGYSDPYHFSRVFKRVAGTAPRNYRRKMRKQ